MSLGGVRVARCLGCRCVLSTGSILCNECHCKADMREPGPWAQARKREREKRREAARQAEAVPPNQ